MEVPKLHILVPKLAFWGNSIMVVHGFSSRNLGRNILKLSNNAAFQWTDFCPKYASKRIWNYLKSMFWNQNVQLWYLHHPALSNSLPNVPVFTSFRLWEGLFCVWDHLAPHRPTAYWLIQENRPQHMISWRLTNCHVGIVQRSTNAKN